MFIGSDLNRSIIPEFISAFNPIAADAPANAIVCTKIPGIRKDLYELSPTSIAPPKTYAKSKIKIIGWTTSKNRTSGFLLNLSKFLQAITEES